MRVSGLWRELSKDPREECLQRLSWVVHFLHSMHLERPCFHRFATFKQIIRKRTFSLDLRYLDNLFGWLVQTFVKILEAWHTGYQSRKSVFLPQKMSSHITTLDIFLGTSELLKFKSLKSHFPLVRFVIFRSRSLESSVQCKKKFTLLPHFSLNFSLVSILSLHWGLQFEEIGQESYLDHSWTLPQ